MCFWHFEHRVPVGWAWFEEMDEVLDPQDSFSLMGLRGGIGGGELSTEERRAPPGAVAVAGGDDRVSCSGKYCSLLLGDSSCFCSSGCVLELLCVALLELEDGSSSILLGRVCRPTE